MANKEHLFDVTRNKIKEKQQRKTEQSERLIIDVENEDEWKILTCKTSLCQTEKAVT